MRGSRKHRMGKSHTGQELGDDQQEREEPKHRAPPVLQCHVRPRIPWLQGLALPLGPAAAPLCQPPPPLTTGPGTHSWTCSTGSAHSLRWFEPGAPLVRSGQAGMQGSSQKCCNSICCDVQLKINPVNCFFPLIIHFFCESHWLVSARGP